MKEKLYDRFTKNSIEYFSNCNLFIKDVYSIIEEIKFVKSEKITISKIKKIINLYQEKRDDF